MVGQEDHEMVGDYGDGKRKFQQNLRWKSGNEMDKELEVVVPLSLCHGDRRRLGAESVLGNVVDWSLF